MTCKNTTNNIVVIFEKLGINLAGKIKILPLELINKWTVEKNGEANIRNAVKEAEEVFLRAYKKDNYENEIDEEEKNVFNSGNFTGISYQ